MEGAKPYPSDCVTFRQCVAHLCMLLGDQLDSSSAVLGAFLTHFKNSNPTFPDATDFLQSINASAVPHLQRAWCRVVAECARSQQVDCITTLLDWLNTYYHLGFPTGLACAVENIRVYVLLRSLYQASHFDDNSRDTILELLTKLPLFPLLPFMNTTIDTDEFSDIVECALGVGDADSLFSVVDGEEEDDDLASPSSLRSREVGQNRLDEDFENDEALSACAKFTILFEYVHEEEFASHGPFDRNLLDFCFQMTSTRTSSYLSLLAYLEYLEENSDEIGDFTSRYVSCSERLTEMTKRYLPASAVAGYIYEAVTRQCHLCLETFYSYKIVRSTQELLSVVLQLLRHEISMMRKNARAGLRRRSASVGTSRDGRFDPEEFRLAPPGTLVAEVDDVWLQVASRLERTSLKNTSELASIRTGVFRLYNDKMAWYLVAEDEKDTEIAELQLPSAPNPSEELDRIRARLRLPTPLYSPLRDTSLGEAATVVAEFYSCLRNEQSQEDRYLNNISRTHASEVEARLPDRCLRDSLVTVPFEAIEKFTYGPIDKTRFNVSIYTDRVFHIFPLSQLEAEELVRAIAEFSGLEPFERDENVAAMLRDKLEQVRLKILIEELFPRHTESPWITNTNELSKALNSLTNEKHPLKLVTLEWLYHSCHANPAVVKETVKALQHIWTQKPSEQGRIRVLSIFERILEGGVVHTDSETLQSILDWLQDIEIQLDPHKYPRTLKVILNLSKMAQIQQSQTIAPMPFSDSSADFDLPGEHSMFLALFQSNS